MESEKNMTGLSEQAWAQITALWNWSVDVPVDCFMLYHYYKGHTLRKVIRKNKLLFRLAAAETFSDKMEGKAVEVYFDLALEELLSEHKITDTQFSKLSEMDVPRRMGFSFKDGEYYRYSNDEPFEEYIICFSKERDDLYMFETYAEESDGYCIHLHSDEIEELKNLGMDNHAVIKLIPVLYGREAIDYIKRKVMEAVTDPVKEEEIEYYVGSILHYVQFAAKRKKYAREKEVRLVVFLPQKCDDSLPNIQFQTDYNQNRFILFSVPNDMLFDVTAAPYNAKAETQGMRVYLEESGYSRMLDEDAI